MGRILDPVALPAEIQNLIFDRLPYLDLIRCLSVSRRWKAAVSATSKLRTTIDLSGLDRIDGRRLASLFAGLDTPVSLTLLSTPPYDSIYHTVALKNIQQSRTLQELNIVQHHMPSLDILTSIVTCPHDFAGAPWNEDPIFCTDQACQQLPWARKLQRLEDFGRPIIHGTSVDVVGKVLWCCPDLVHIRVARVDGGICQFPPESKWHQMPLQKFESFHVDFYSWRRSSPEYTSNMQLLLVRCAIRDVGTMAKLEYQKYVLKGGQESLVELSVGNLDLNFLSAEGTSQRCVSFLPLSRLRSLKLSSIPLTKLPRLPPTLQELTLSECWEPKQDASASQKWFSNMYLPNLKSLELVPFSTMSCPVYDHNGTKFLTEIFKDITCSNESGLESLILPQFDVRDKDFESSLSLVSQILQSNACRNLRHLVISISDDDLKFVRVLTKCTTQLEELDLGDTPILDNSVQILAKAIRLKWLYIRMEPEDCLTPPTLEFLRRREVQCKRSAGSVWY